jgi:hypothetical protein
MANPTTNYSFAMPTNTDLVKDLPADFDIFGQAVDDRVKALNPETTAGDISYRASTANAKTRLGIGTAGQVLTVNSGATAPEWATITSGANFTLLNTGGTALTGAQTITVSGISGKDKIVVIVDSASSASASSDMSIRFNTDTGANYAYAGNQFIGDAAYSAGSFGGFKGLTATSMPIGKLGNNAGSLLHATLFLTGGNSTGLKMLQLSGGGTDTGGGTGMRSYNVGGFYNSASTISSVSVFSGTGNFDNGTVYVYTSA